MAYAREPGLVSVVVTSRDSAGSVRECLNALAKQTYRKLELIVVDDASRDGTPAAIREWEEKRSRRHAADRAKAPIPPLLLLALPRPVGYAGAATAGLFLARGEYIAMQDADDMSHPQRIARQAEYLERHAAIGLLGTNYAVFEDGVVPPSERNGAGWLKYGPSIRAAYAAGEHCVFYDTVMMRGALFDRLGGHTRRSEGAEDGEFIARALGPQGEANADNLPDILYYCRRREGQRPRSIFGQSRMKPH